MTDQNKNEENSFGGKFLVNALYVLTALLILGFFIQSATAIVVIE